MMRIHIVRPKETFVTIANKYQVTMDDLRQFNPDFIQPDCLVAGMKVYIPNLKKVTETFSEEIEEENEIKSNVDKNKQDNFMGSLELKQSIAHVSSEKQHVSSDNKDSQEDVTTTSDAAMKKVKHLPTKQPIEKYGSTLSGAKKKKYQPWPPIKRPLHHSYPCPYGCWRWYL
ncbi:hypothetical protein GCM10012290_09400 [Halolactibacillus alkaliphilus]|uniref:LysM domain-containing protein n=1 Tax=Halolactibacillus alkaliphilus TaxID=442899 RepID=A0A511WY22_9BACI|nr:LysM domain-containing protein [Halolactibacillus alkaliphilus]GEN56016.1 hypothetical protein HAL01_04800 [Halolactibacillus alkaliphilus]GGN68121.1 hypothetical protein GCM10012290_09400 [Halolactibacillus alkaliphilus]